MCGTPPFLITLSLLSGMPVKLTQMRSFSTMITHLRTSAKANYIYNLGRDLKFLCFCCCYFCGLSCEVTWTVNRFSPSVNDITSNIKRLTDLGLEVHITELDVSYDGGSGSDQNKAAAQGVLYGILLKGCLANPNCTHFISWGFTDKYTWLQVPFTI